MVHTQLRNKVVLITGVNNPIGVGAATAKAFAAEGARIFGTYFPLPAIARTIESYGLEFYEAQISKTPDEVVDAIRQLGATIEVVPADLTDPEIIPRLFEQAEKALGPVDVLVNNAAYDAPDAFVPRSLLSQEDKTVWDSPIAAITADSHDRHFSVNCRAVALMMADLLALQPTMDIRLHIVAPTSRREKVFQEIRRPVFSLLERGPLSEA